MDSNMAANEGRNAVNINKHFTGMSEHTFTKVGLNVAKWRRKHQVFSLYSITLRTGVLEARQVICPLYYTHLL
jgi:hypothetical protein